MLFLKKKKLLTYNLFTIYFIWEGTSFAPQKTQKNSGSVAGAALFGKDDFSSFMVSIYICKRFLCIDAFIYMRGCRCKS